MHIEFDNGVTVFILAHPSDKKKVWLSATYDDKPITLSHTEISSDDLPMALERIKLYFPKEVEITINI